MLKKIWRENGKYQGGDMQETVRGNSARAKVCFFFTDDILYQQTTDQSENMLKKMDKVEAQKAQLGLMMKP